MLKQALFTYLVCFGSLYAMQSDVAIESDLKRLKLINPAPPAMPLAAEHRELDGELFPASASVATQVSLPASAELGPIIGKYILERFGTKLFLQRRMDVPRIDIVHPTWVKSATFNAAGDRIVTTLDNWDGRFNGLVKVWNANSGECISTLDHKPLVGEGVQHFTVYWASFNERGDNIVTATTEGAYIWDVHSAMCIRKLEGQIGVKSAQFNKAGDRILTGGLDWRAKLWDARSGECLRTFDEHEAEVNTARFYPGETLIITASEDGTAKVWHNNDTGERFFTFSTHDNPQEETIRVCSAEFNATGDRILTATNDGLVKIWNDTASRCILTLQLDDDSSDYYASFNRLGDKVITSADDAKIWDVATGICLYQLPYYYGMYDVPSVTMAEFDRSGDKVVAVQGDKTVNIWDIGFLEKIFKRLTLEQVFLLKAIHEVVILRRLVKLREKRSFLTEERGWLVKQAVYTEDGRIVKEADILFDFSSYEHLKAAYADLPESLKKVLCPYIINQLSSRRL